MTLDAADAGQLCVSCGGRNTLTARFCNQCGLTLGQSFDATTLTMERQLLKQHVFETGGVDLARGCGTRQSSSDSRAYAPWDALRGTALSTR